MRERWDPFASSSFEFRGGSALLKSDRGKTTETQEVDPGNSIPLDKLESEKRNHRNQPGYSKECPASIDCHDQPDARTQKEKSARYYETIIEYSDLTDSLREETKIPGLTRAQVRIPDTNKARTYEYQPEKMDKSQNRVGHLFVFYI